MRLIGNLGDMDNDGMITANDALMILRSSIGVSELTIKQEKIADVDADNDITSSAALCVLRYSVNLGGNYRTGERAN